MRPTSETRLLLIDLLAYWEGRVNTTDLIKHFGISRQQSSKDLQQYQQAHPGNLRYSASQKAYVPTEQFTPHYHAGQVETYLQWMQTGQLDACRASVEVHALPVFLCGGCGILK